MYIYIPLVYAPPPPPPPPPQAPSPDPVRPPSTSPVASQAQGELLLFVVLITKDGVFGTISKMISGASGLCERGFEKVSNEV